MKGITFLKPLEYTMITTGEEWKQGEPVKGTVTVKNHGGEKRTLSSLRAALAHASFRDVHAKAADAFEIVDNQVLAPTLELAPGEQREFSWQFALSNDCPITDKRSSLYLLYGAGQDPWQGGMLQMTVDLRPMLYEFIKIFQDFYRFQMKEKKYKQGMVDIKFNSPKSREFANVETVHCMLRLKGEIMEVNYIFSVKELGMVSGQAQVQKLIKEFTQELTPRQYELFKGAPNPEGIKNSIGEILKQVIPKFLY